MPRTSLGNITKQLNDCSRCSLCLTRKSIVFGEGHPNADWMLVGEAPEKAEDQKGRPFVGPSGEVVNKLLSESGWSREYVYMSNIVKCRPPKNRDPQLDEIEECKPFLFRQIRSVCPKVIVTLGKQATNLLLGYKDPLYKMRGRVYEVLGVAVVPTYHPACVLRGTPGALKAMKMDFDTALTLL